MELRVDTPKEWVNTALSDFDHFLIDHASCERKASAVGMSFVVRYPDRSALLEPMIQFAREELEHAADEGPLQRGDERTYAAPEGQFNAKG